MGSAVPACYIYYLQLLHSSMSTMFCKISHDVEGESVLLRSSILSCPVMANEVSVKEKIEGRSWSWESMDMIGTMSEYLAEVINMITHPQDTCAWERSWTKESAIVFGVHENFLFSQLQ